MNAAKVFYHKPSEMYFWLEDVTASGFILRQITKDGRLLNRKKVIKVFSDSYTLVPNCKVQIRILFNQAFKDKLAFDDFIEFMNTELIEEITEAIKDKDTEDVLSKTEGIVFSIMHLQKKNGVTFQLSDILEKLNHKNMRVAVKKSMIRYCKMRCELFSDGNKFVASLEDERLIMELDSAQIVYRFSEGHKKIQDETLIYFRNIMNIIKNRGGEVHREARRKYVKRKN